MIIYITNVYIEALYMFYIHLCLSHNLWDEMPKRSSLKGVLWLMVSTTEGLTEIRAWDVSVGQAQIFFLLLTPFSLKFFLS